MRFPRFNITHKFIGYLIFLSIIPLLVVGVVSLQTSSNVLKEVASHYTMQLVINQRDYLDLQLMQVESLISNLAGVEEIRDVLEDVNLASDTYTQLTTQANIGYILNGYSNLQGLVSIDIFTVGGSHYHVGDTLNTKNIRTDIKDRIFNEALEGEQSVIWVGIEDNVNANSSYQKVVTAAKALYKFNRETLQQEPTALFLVNYSVEYLYAHLNEIDLGDNAYMTVIDNKGRLIYHPDQSKLGELVNADLAQIIATDNNRQELVLDNTNMSINFVHSDISDWTIVSLIPINTLLTKTGLIARTTVVVLLLCFIAVTIIGWFYNHRVVTPIRQITLHFKQVQEESIHTEQKHLPVQGNDEIAELSQWFNTFMDVLKARHEAEKQQIELALERERMHLLTHFITEASHEFRTPLTIIATNTYLLGKSSDVDKQVTRLNNIDEQVTNITTLVDSLLEMTKLDSGGHQFILVSVNLNELLQMIHQEALSILQQKNIECVMMLSESPLLIQGDADYLKDAIQRICNNAIQHTPSDGKIIISTRSIDHHTSIEITNTGTGILDEDLPHIFKRFYRSDKSGTTRGFGLGLPIAKTIIELHQGSIHVESAEGKGSTFIISLPLMSSDSLTS